MQLAYFINYLSHRKKKGKKKERKGKGKEKKKMANGFSQGLNTGLRLFSNFDYRDRTKQQQDRLDKTAERKALIEQIDLSQKVFNDSKMPDYLKVEEYNNVYIPAMRKLSGNTYPEISGWGPDFTKITKSISDVIANTGGYTKLKQRQLLHGITQEAQGNPYVKDMVQDAMTDMENKWNATVDRDARFLLKHAKDTSGTVANPEDEEYNNGMQQRFKRKRYQTGVMDRLRELEREKEEKQPKITGRGTAIGAWIREQVEEKGKDLGETVQLADKLFPKESDWKVMLRMLRPDLFPDDPGNTGDTGDTDDPLGIGSKLID